MSKRADQIKPYNFWKLKLYLIKKLLFKILMIPIIYYGLEILVINLLTDLDILEIILI